MKAIHPAELRGWGTRRGGIVRFAGGADIAPEVAERLAACFIEPRYGLLHEMRHESEPSPSFVEELAARGYDLSSFRFSVFLASARRKVAKRPQVIRQVPGVLRARWARVEYDSPDVCTSWHVPARRADSSLFMHILSSGAYCPSEVEARQRAGLWGQPNMELFELGVLTRLERAGFDKRTLRFSVRHAQPPESAADGSGSS